MTAFVDTNILVRHLTGEPADQAANARRILSSGEPLYLVDLVVAELAYVLESYYRAPRPQVAEAIRSLVAQPSIVTDDPAMLLRAVEVYEVHRIDFADAYLVAVAESSGIHRIASFDRDIERPGTVERIDDASA